ncbi:hypothetical protein EC973_005526 [Apophysomyces ossiformis]|uniref:Uncharacterized protein n=1 Tax=Apophysomyces ossiformis TaxID=679940 RepID=A0A8H7EK38_9FUNG|nr:hypothetical protein EC973_005526 [Apophysomyces ossiformis]
MSEDNIWIAAGDGQLARVKELIEGGVDVNSRDEFGYTAMHAAVSYNQEAMIKLLLQYGADINIEDSDKDTPLFVAEKVEIAQLLLDKGSDAYHQNAEGMTAAMNAHQEGMVEVAEFLAKITGETLPSGEDDECVLPDMLEGMKNEIQDEDLIAKVKDLVQQMQQNGGTQSEEEIEKNLMKILMEKVEKNE